MFQDETTEITTRNFTCPPILRPPAKDYPVVQTKSGGHPNERKRHHRGNNLDRSKPQHDFPDSPTCKSTNWHRNSRRMEQTSNGSKWGAERKTKRGRRNLGEAAGAEAETAWTRTRRGEQEQEREGKLRRGKAVASQRAAGGVGAGGRRAR